MTVSTWQLFILHGVPNPIWTYLVVTENSEEHCIHAKCHLSVHHLSCPEWSQQRPLNLFLYSSLFHSPGHVHRLGKASQTFLLSSRWCLSTPGTLEDASFSTPTLVLSTADVWGQHEGAAAMQPMRWWRDFEGRFERCYCVKNMCVFLKKYLINE